MLTSKQRAYLRGIAAKEDTIFQVGKGGIGENLIDQVRDALKAREIVKIKVLDAAMLSAAEAAEVCRGHKVRGSAGNRQQAHTLQEKSPGA